MPWLPGLLLKYLVHQLGATYSVTEVFKKRRSKCLCSGHILLNRINRVSWPTFRQIADLLLSLRILTFRVKKLIEHSLSPIPAEMTIVVCEDDKKANLLLDQSPRCLRKLVTIKEVSPSTHQRAKSRGVEIVKFSDVEILGAQKDHPCVVSVFRNEA